MSSPRILVLSDLHREYSTEEYMPIQDGYDMVVLAGDIDVKLRGIEWAQKNFNRPVVYIPGNHEFWGRNLQNHRRDMKAAAEGSHVHVLDNDELILQGIRFLGGTSWTDFSTWRDPHEASIAAGRGKDMYGTGSRDYRKITSVGYRKLLPRETIEMARQTKKWLVGKFSEPFNGHTVVVTHHAPSPKSLKEGRAIDILDACDANAWDELVMQSNVSLWIHGHTHNSRDYLLGNTRVFCNAMGGIKEGIYLNPEFSDRAILIL